MKFITVIIWIFFLYLTGKLIQKLEYKAPFNDPVRHFSNFLYFRGITGRINGLLTGLLGVMLFLLYMPVVVGYAFLSFICFEWLIANLGHLV